MLNKVDTIKSLIFLLLIICSGLTQTTIATTSKQNKDKDFHVGVCTHFSQGKGIIEMNIRSMKNAGIGAIRDEATWSSLERQKGRLVKQVNTQTGQLSSVQPMFQNIHS